MKIKIITVAILIMSIFSGVTTASEIISLTCPECGCHSGVILTGIGKSATGMRTIFFEPAENRFVGVFMNVGLLFQQDRGLELENSFFLGGGDEWELWEEYLGFLEETVWPDTIWFEDLPAWFSLDVPEVRSSGYMFRIEEPYRCPLCGGYMDHEITGHWD